MNHTLLLAEIQKPEYKSLDLSGTVAALRAKTVAVPAKALPEQKVILDLVASGNYAQARSFIDLTKNLFAYVDPQTVLLPEFLGGLVTAGVMDQPTRDAIEKYRTEAVPLLMTLECSDLLAMDAGSAADHIQLAQGIDPQATKAAAALAVDLANGLTRDATGRAIIPAGMMLDTSTGKLVAKP